MKTPHPVSLLTRRASLVLTLAAFVPALLADEPAAAAAKAGDQAADRTADKIADYRADASELNKAEVKAALDQIDAELRHLDTLADAAPTPALKSEAKARHARLKETRAGLQREFTRARYEAFKADVKEETDRLGAWARETFTNKPAANSAASTAVDTAENTAAKIADYRADASDVNKAEVKASLDRLDADIDLLDAKTDAVTDSVRKDELKVRLRALKDRRSELSSEFRKARYDALVADVKAEWNKLVN
jgi:hypothetical protein